MLHGDGHKEQEEEDSVEGLQEAMERLKLEDEEESGFNPDGWEDAELFGPLTMEQSCLAKMVKNGQNHSLSYMALIPELEGLTDEDFEDFNFGKELESEQKKMMMEKEMTMGEKRR